MENKNKLLKIFIISLVIILGIANLYLGYQNLTKLFKDKNEIYCVGGEEIKSSESYVNGMKCYILKFEYTNISNKFYNDLMNKSDDYTDLKVCSKKLNPNECNYYDEYFYKKVKVNDDNMIGYYSELVGIVYSNSTIKEVNMFRLFYNNSEKINYEEGYKRLR